MTILFVSDLHLAPDRPAVNRLFLDFLRQEVASAQSLYILGDLFDYWIGDEDGDDPFAAALIRGLRRARDAGCAIFLMHGNRDFLLGPRFAATAGAELIPDPTVLELNGTRTLLMHGDTLCTADTEYQRFRQQVRNLEWQREFLARAPDQRRGLARDLRARSDASKQAKSSALMDVEPREVERVLREHACARLIHGHTHRPGRHEHRVDHRLAERLVLADWSDLGGEALLWSSGELKRIPVRSDLQAASV